VFHSDIHLVVSSSSEDESEYINQDIDDDEIISIVNSQEEDIQDIIDSNIDDSVVEDALDCTFCFKFR
jgi:hypothetical protein